MCHHMFCNLPLYDSESWLSVTICFYVLPLYDSESWLSVTVTYVVCLCMVQRAAWLSVTVCFVSASV